jgi:hypothetical protein
MMEGGRVLHHLRNSLGDPRNAILIVGFQAENTLGRRILRGDGEVNIFGEPHPVRAEIFVMNEYSAHADRDELLSWFRRLRGAPTDVFVVHGEEEQSLAFAEHLRKETTARVEAPRPHEFFGLGGREGRERGIRPSADDGTVRGDPSAEATNTERPRRHPEHETTSRRGRRNRRTRHP